MNDVNDEELLGRQYFGPKVRFLGSYLDLATACVGDRCDDGVAAIKQGNEWGHRVKESRVGSGRVGWSRVHFFGVRESLGFGSGVKKRPKFGTHRSNHSKTGATAFAATFHTPFSSLRRFSMS